MKTTNIVNELNTEHNKEITEYVDKTQLTIDPKGMTHIMSLLTNLYQNGALAIFREYLANGYDSQMRAGNLGEKQIEVNINRPQDGAFKKFDGSVLTEKGVFSVKDYGTGMSHQEMKDIYAKYGNSTKEDENESIGGFGVGAKSALSITDYFEVISIKDGQKIKASIQLESKNIAQMYVLSVEKTDDHNGLEVRIPITDTIAQEIDAESKRFFFAWSKNVVTVNGEEPFWAGYFDNKDRVLPLMNSIDKPIGWVQFLSEEKQAEQTTLTRNNLLDNTRRAPDTFEPLGAYLFPEIFIGGIPYEMDENMLDSEQHTIYSTMLSLGYTIHLNAPIGSLTLTPDRESIQATDENRQVIASLLTNVIMLIPGALNEHLQSLPPEKAYSFAHWNTYGLSPTFSFKSWTENPTRLYSLDDHKDDYNIIPAVTYRGKEVPKKIVLTDYFSSEAPMKLYSTISNTFDKYVLHPFTEINLLSMATRSSPLDEQYRPERKSHYKPLSVFLYGQYSGKSSDPIKSSLLIAMKEKKLVPTGKWNVIYVEEETVPPDVIKYSMPTYHINEIEAIAKETRKKNNADKLKSVGKNRSSAIYPIAKYNAEIGLPEITMLTRKEYSEIDEEIILLQELNTHTSKSRWAEALKVINLETTVRDESFQSMDSYVEEWPTTYFSFVPHTRSANVLIKANPKSVMIQDKLSSYFDNLTPEKKKEIVLMNIIQNSMAGLSFTRDKQWEQIDNVYLRSLYEKFALKDSEEYRKLMLIIRLPYGHRISSIKNNVDFQIAAKALKDLLELIQYSKLKPRHYNKLLELPEFHVE
jgi:hypothetical protein